MTFALIVLHHGYYDLIRTFHNLDICLTAASKLDGMCVTLDILEKLN